MNDAKSIMDQLSIKCDIANNNDATSIITTDDIMHLEEELKSSILSVSLIDHKLKRSLSAEAGNDNSITWALMVSTKSVSNDPGIV